MFLTSFKRPLDELSDFYVRAVCTYRRFDSTLFAGAAINYSMSPFNRLNPSKKNYATFNERFSTEEGKEDEVVCGAHVRDVITGEEFDVRAKCVVNATGPFTDAIRKMDDPTERNICQPSSGVHIVLPEYYRYCRLRKHTTPTGLLAKKPRNSILMTCHYPDQSSAFDWLMQISYVARPIRSATQIWVLTRHQYGISALVPQSSFRGETIGDVSKCRLFPWTAAASCSIALFFG